MSGRLPSGLLVAALLRRVNDAGGFGVVRARGDAQAGAILIALVERDRPTRFVERGLGTDCRTGLIESTPETDADGYWAKRRARDPDLWVVELDIAGGERFAAETILDD